MMRKIKQLSRGLLAAGLLVLASGVKAQSAADFRINEVLVENQTNCIDDFGQHSPWIEIYNSAYNYVDIAGLYLTNDLDNPTMYQIPKGDPITLIAPQSYLVFWADDHASRGIRHLNFDLKNSKLVALFDGDGKTLIDVVKLDGVQRVDTTFGRFADGGTQWGYLEKSTPGANNTTKVVITSADKFGAMDPFGVGMTIIAMTVVFSALAILYVFFKNVARLYGVQWSKLFSKKQIGALKEAANDDELTGEISAAIAMALHLYQNQLHDHENTILTIRKVAKTYSPWSSKIYGVLNRMH